MKKRILVIAAACMLVLGLAACNKADTDGPKPEDTDTKAAEETVDTDILKGTYTETGHGEFEVSTPAGDSDDGNVPVLYASADDVLVQIGTETEDINGELLSFIYVDKHLVDKDQYRDTQSTIDLKGSMLKPGVHDVALVQYEDNDPEKEVVTFKTAQYEVKEK